MHTNVSLAEKKLGAPKNLVGDYISNKKYCGVNIFDLPDNVSWSSFYQDDDGTTWDWCTGMVCEALIKFYEQNGDEFTLHMVSNGNPRGYESKIIRLDKNFNSFEASGLTTNKKPIKLYKCP